MSEITSPSHPSPDAHPGPPAHATPEHEARRKGWRDRLPAWMHSAADEFGQEPTHAKLATIYYALGICGALLAISAGVWGFGKYLWSEKAAIPAPKVEIAQQVPRRPLPAETPNREEEFQRYLSKEVFRTSAPDKLKALQVIADSSPDNWHAWYEFGTFAHVAGQWDKADEALRRSLRLARDKNNAPLEVMSLVRWGECLMKQTDRVTAGQDVYERARKLVTQGLSEADVEQPLMGEMATVLDRLSEYLKSREQFEDAVKVAEFSILIRRKLVARSQTLTDWPRYAWLHDGPNRTSLTVPIAKANIGSGSEFVLAQASPTAQVRTPGAPTSLETRQRELASSYEKAGDLYTAKGDFSSAEQAYHAALTILQRLTDRDSANARLQRDVTILNNKLGDVFTMMGRLAEAARVYEQSMVIARSLIARDPSNISHQRNLSIAINRLADLDAARGDIDGALAKYRDALAIRQRLGSYDPTNTEMSGDVSGSYLRIGDALLRKGSRDEALSAYHAGLRAAAVSGLQPNLIISYERIGDILKDKGDRDGALAAYQEGLAIVRKLADRDPSNIEWQRSLSVSFNNIGDTLRDKGDRDGALKAHQDGLAIARKLVERDPSHIGWQRDLSVSFNRIGDSLRDKGDRDGSLKAYQDGLAIARTLADRDPSNIEWQRGLSVSFDKIGNILSDKGDRDGALKAYQDGLAIARTLAERAPSVVQWQLDVAVSLWRLAALGVNARANFQEVVGILEKLENAGTLTAEQRRWLPMAKEQLASAK